MNREKKKNIKLGIFVTVALILFTILIYNVGSTTNFFGSSVKVSTTFDRVNGLRAGNIVRYSGIDVGSVDDLVFVSDSTVRVEMLLDKEVLTFMKSDAIASLGTDGLVGDVIVNINPGNNNGIAIKNGAILNSNRESETQEIISTLGETAKNLTLITQNLIDITTEMKSGKGSMALMLNDEAMANDFKQAMDNVKQTSKNINRLSLEVDKTVQGINQGEGLIGYLLKDSLFEKKINEITLNLDTLIKVKTAPLIENLTKSSEDIALTSTELKSFVQKTDLNGGVAGAILGDTAVTLDLKATMENLSEGTHNFNESMEALRNHWLFRNYFKKRDKKKGPID